MDAGLVNENNLGIEFPQADDDLLDGGEDEGGDCTEAKVDS